MAPIPVINRGFGGSTMPDANQYFDQTVGKYKPKLIVYYEGDNDISAKRTTDQLLADPRQTGQIHVDAQRPENGQTAYERNQAPP